MAIRYRNAMALVFLFGFQSAILVLLSLFMVRWVFIWLLCFFSYLSSYSSFEIVFSFCFVGFVGLTSILGVYGGRRCMVASGLFWLVACRCRGARRGGGGTKWWNVLEQS
ncbi:hypothetical protein MANES_08G082633v8 [Manihot esculenta]|uniref:Uncharacterized protein n=1 Tax=Manihot esculenta TaxID=3983 RepID=A0ACB7HBH3_MANES|nr:hypothetical protein MANES_08G082633v8 [Manihot esculenta]